MTPLASWVLVAFVLTLSVAIAAALSIWVPRRTVRRQQRIIDRWLDAGWGDE